MFSSSSLPCSRINSFLILILFLLFIFSFLSSSLLSAQTTNESSSSTITTTTTTITTTTTTTQELPTLRRSDNFTVLNASSGMPFHLQNISSSTYLPIDISEEDLTTNFPMLPEHTPMSYLIQHSAVKLRLSLGNSGLKFSNGSRFELTPGHPLFQKLILRCAKQQQGQVKNISNTVRAVGTDAQSLLEVGTTMFNPAAFEFNKDNTEMNVTLVRSFNFDIQEPYSFRLNFGSDCLDERSLSTQRDVSPQLFDVDFNVQPMRRRKILFFGRGKNMTSLEVARGLASYQAIIVGDRFIGTGFNNQTATGIDFDDLCPRDFFSTFGCQSVNVSHNGRHLRVVLQTNVSFYVRQDTTVNIPLYPEYFRETNTSSPFYQPENDDSTMYLPVHIRLSPGVLSISARPRITEEEVRTGTIGDSTPGVPVSFIIFSLTGDAFRNNTQELAKYYLDLLLDQQHVSCLWMQSNPNRLTRQEGSNVDPFGFCGKMKQSLLRSAEISSRNQILTFYLTGDEDFDVFLEEFVELSFPQPEQVIDQTFRNETTGEIINVTYKWSNGTFYLNETFQSGFLPTLTRTSGFVVSPVQGRFWMTQGFSEITEDEIRDRSVTRKQSNYRFTFHLQNERWGSAAGVFSADPATNTPLISSNPRSIEEAVRNLISFGFKSQVQSWQNFGWDAFGVETVSGTETTTSISLSSNYRDLTFDIGYSSNYRVSANETIIIKIPTEAILSPLYEPIFDRQRTTPASLFPNFTIIASPGKYEVYPKLIKASWLNQLPNNITTQLRVLLRDQSSASSLSKDIARFLLSSSTQHTSILVGLRGDEFDRMKLGNFWNKVVVVDDSSSQENNNFMTSNVITGLEPNGFNANRDLLFDTIRRSGVNDVDTLTDSILDDAVWDSTSSRENYFKTPASTSPFDDLNSCFRTKMEKSPQMNTDFCGFAHLRLKQVPNYFLKNSQNEVVSLHVSGNWVTSGVAPSPSSSSSNTITILPTFKTINAFIVAEKKSVDGNNGGSTTENRPSWPELQQKIATFLNMGSETTRIQLSTSILLDDKQRLWKSNISTLPNSLFSSSSTKKFALYFVSFRIAASDSNQPYKNSLDPVNGVVFDDAAVDNFIKRYSLTKELFEATSIAVCWERSGSQSVADDYLERVMRRYFSSSQKDSTSTDLQKQELVAAFDSSFFPLAGSSPSWKRLASIIEVAFFEKAFSVLDQVSEESRTSWTDLPIIANPAVVREEEARRQKEEDDDMKKVLILLAVFIPLVVIGLVILIVLLIERKHGCIARWWEERKEMKEIESSRKREEDEMKEREKERRQEEEMKTARKKQQQTEKETPLVVVSSSPDANEKNTTSNKKNKQQPTSADYQSPFAEFVKDAGEGTLASMKGAIGTGVARGRGGRGGRGRGRGRGRTEAVPPQTNRKPIHGDLAMFNDDFAAPTPYADDDDDDLFNYSPPSSPTKTQPELQQNKVNHNDENSRDFEEENSSDDDDDDLHPPGDFEIVLDDNGGFKTSTSTLSRPHMKKKPKTKSFVAISSNPFATTTPTSKVSSKQDQQPKSSSTNNTHNDNNVNIMSPTTSMILDNVQVTTFNDEINNDIVKRPTPSSSPGEIEITSSAMINDFMDPVDVFTNPNKNKKNSSRHKQESTTTYKDPFFDDDDYDTFYGIPQQQQQETRNPMVPHSTSPYQPKQRQQQQRKRPTQSVAQQQQQQFYDNNLLLPSSSSETSATDSDDLPDYNQVYNNVDSSNYYSHPTRATHSERFGGGGGGSGNVLSPSRASSPGSSPSKRKKGGVLSPRGKRSNTNNNSNNNPLEESSRSRRRLLMSPTGTVNQALPLPPSSPPPSGSSMVDYGGASVDDSPQSRKSDQEVLNELFGDL